MKPNVVVSRPVDEIEELNIAEKQMLDACEHDIQKADALASRAFEKIRERRLYRGKFSNFDNYCQFRWKMSRRKVDRLIQHATVIADIVGESPELEPAVSSISKSAASELHGLPAQEQSEIVQDAIEQHGTPTAQAIRDAKSSRSDGDTTSSQRSSGNVPENAANNTPSSPAKTGSKSSRVVTRNPAAMIDEIATKHISPAIKTLDEVAELNGGKGPHYDAANSHLNQLLDELKVMRKGEL